MFQTKRSPLDAASIPPRLVAIISKQQVVELWHIQHQRTNYRERETSLPTESRTRVVDGRRERCDVHRRQVAVQAWGHFVIRRYRATRIGPWMPSLGLGMLIPGALMAAGTASQGALNVPIGILILQTALVSIGGLMAVASGWRLLTDRLRPTDGAPLESLGVSGRTLGFSSDTIASEPVPKSYRPGRFSGYLEVEIPVGQWSVVEHHTSEAGWHRISDHLHRS
jgi:hypothetical protein